jgi:hypothetical protein
VVVAGCFASQHGTITAGSLAVTGIVKPFGKNTPLHRGVVVIVKADVFFGRPGKGAVVYNKITAVLDVQAGSRYKIGRGGSDFRVVNGIVEYPHPGTDMAYN